MISMFDVITMGSATVDVFADTYSELLTIQTEKEAVKHICYPSGTKIKVKKFNSATELSVRVNQKNEERGFGMNNITVMESGIEERNGKKNMILILTKDVNNVVSNENDFSNENISEFFSVTGDIVSWKEIFKMFE